MKNNIKALPLSLALSLLAFVGACSSVNSTPNSEVPGESNSVIIEGSEEATEAIEDLSPELEESAIDTEASDEVEAAEGELVDGVEDKSAIDTEANEDSAELNPLDSLREKAIDQLDDESAIDTEANDEVEAAEGEDVPEVILPESDSAEVETDSESAENNLVPEIKTAE